MSDKHPCPFMLPKRLLAHTMLPVRCSSVTAIQPIMTFFGSTPARVEPFPYMLCNSDARCRDCREAPFASRVAHSRRGRVVIFSHQGPVGL
jgi:hypothetical protein